MVVVSITDLHLQLELMRYDNVEDIQSNHSLMLVRRKKVVMIALSFETHIMHIYVYVYGDANG